MWSSGRRSAGCTSSSGSRSRRLGAAPAVIGNAVLVVAGGKQRRRVERERARPVVMRARPRDRVAALAPERREVEPARRASSAIRSYARAVRTRPRVDAMPAPPVSGRYQLSVTASRASCAASWGGRRSFARGCPLYTKLNRCVRPEAPCAAASAAERFRPGLVGARLRAPEAVPSPTRRATRRAQGSVCASASTARCRRHSPSIAPPCRGGEPLEQRASCCRATTPASASDWPPSSSPSARPSSCTASCCCSSLALSQKLPLEFLERLPVEPVEQGEGDLPHAGSVGMHDPDLGDAATARERDPLAVR